MVSRTEGYPRVTAIVVNFNGGSRTLRCIESLRQQTIAFERIVVVDNASSDGSVDEIALRFPDTTVLSQRENLGASAARNIGLRFAETPFVLSIDCDMYLRSDALEVMLETQVEMRPAIVCPRIVLYPARDLIQFDGAELHFTCTYWLRNAHSTNLDDERGPVIVGGAPSGCLLLDRVAALEAGGFNERYFFYYEDFEFSLRMRALGYDTICARSAIADHDRGDGTPGLSFRGSGEYPTRRAYLTIRNRLLTIGIHYSLRCMLVLLPGLFLYELGTLGFAVVRGWLPEYGRAWASVIAQRRLIMADRRFVRARRRRSDRALFTADKLAFGAGVMRARSERWLASALVLIIDAYWRLARPLLGRYTQGDDRANSPRK